MMKKLFFTSLVLCSFIFSVQAQQAVKVGPLGFLFGNYNLRYERALNDKGSVQVGANFYSYKLFDIKSTGFGIDAGYRHYFKEAIKGAYVSPAVGLDFNSTNATITSTEKLGFTLLGVGATVGYQWVSGGGFVTDLGLGYGYNAEIGKDDKLVNDYGGGGVRFTFAIGYSF